MSRYFDTTTAQWVEGELPPRAVPIGGGAGTELKKLLAGVGIVAAAGCQCNAMARRMDAEGVEWCRANIETITAVMVREATLRGWLKHAPFKELGARMIVRKAIERARA